MTIAQLALRQAALVAELSEVMAASAALTGQSDPTPKRPRRSSYVGSALCVR